MNSKPQPELKSKDRITAAGQVRGIGLGRQEEAMGDQRPPGGRTSMVAFFDGFRPGKVRLNPANRMVDRIRIGLGLALLSALMGCVGYVSEHHRGPVMLPVPEVHIFGGFYERGVVVHDYSRRGYESRGWAHPVGGPPGRNR